MKILFITFLVLSLCRNTGKESVRKFILWNVGQGQWATLVTSKYCHHIDAGGEFMDWKLLKKNCEDKKNYLSFTHYDWDHIRFAKKLSSRFRSLCLQRGIHYPISPGKRNFLKTLPLCNSTTSHTRVLFSGNSKSANHLSRVFSLIDQILIPGDSPKALDKLWLGKADAQLQVLVLSHHGSHTGTSKQILRRFSFKQALVSARRRRYGHPHKKVLRRLRKNRVPLVDTEQWGNIHIVLEK